MSDFRAHQSTAVVAENVVSQFFGHGVPVACREVCLDALVGLDRSVFELGCRPAELVEPRERGVKVALIEDLAAAERFTISGEQHDLSPLGIEALG